MISKVLNYRKLNFNKNLNETWSSGSSSNSGHFEMHSQIASPFLSTMHSLPHPQIWSSQGFFCTVGDTET